MRCGGAGQSSRRCRNTAKGVVKAQESSDECGEVWESSDESGEVQESSRAEHRKAQNLR